MKIKRQIFIYVFIFIVACTAIYVLFIKKDKIAIGFQPGSVNYPMMYAIEEGYFTNQGIDFDVQVFRSANDALDALLSNSIFLDAVIPIQNIASIEKQHPGSLGLAAFLISDTIHPLDYLVVLKDSEIKSIKDLAGKTIVVFPGSYSETLTRLTFERLGIDDINFIKRSPQDMPQSLQSGEADAGIFYDPVATKSVADNWGRFLEEGFWEKYLISEIVVGAYTYNNTYANKHPELKQKVQTGLKEAILSARDNPETAKMSTLQYLGAFENIISKLPDSRIEFPNELDPNILDKTIQLYVDHGILDDYVDLKPLLK